MQEHLLSQGFNLMFYGMATVCVFLALLVLVTNLMSAIVLRFFPEQPDVALARAGNVEKTATSVDAKTLKVIQSAIEQHRAKR